MNGDGYSHTQRGIIRPILLLCVAGALVGAWLVQDHPTFPIYVGTGVLFALLSFAFGHLTVRDEGDRLAVRFGPLPIFRKAIPYADITGAERDRSTFLSGWGIHYTRKGWLWNVGGYDCVRIEMGAKSTLIGTDDPDGLVAFLKTRMRTGFATGAD